MYTLVDYEDRCFGDFSSISDATRTLNRLGFSYVDVESWTIEDANILSQYQFFLLYHERN